MDQSVIELFPGEERIVWRNFREFAEGLFFSGIELDKFGDVAPRTIQLERFSHYLAPHECRKLEKFVLPKRRREWLGGRLTAKFAAHLALRSVGISSTLPWSDLVIDNLESGQPVLVFAKDKRVSLPSISISHSNGWAVAMASTKKPCGIDVQLVSSQIQRVKERFCSPQEELVLGGDMTSLTLLWAAKESVRKSFGRKVPPGFQKICLHDIHTLSSEKWHMNFSVLHGGAGGAEKEQFSVGATLVGDHALAFTVRGGSR